VAGEIQAMGFDGLDINMGCPVKKVVGRGSCAGLIANPSLAAELIAAAREGAPDLPLSVKTRVGIGRPVAEEWLGFLLEQDIDALAVHGRTVAQQSEGEADWGTVALAVRLRDAAGLDTLIVGNGDVRTALDFQERAAQTHADGIMIGRGIFENVSIFGAIRAAAQGLPPEAHDYGALDPVRKVELFRRHMTLFRETWGTGGNYHALKKFAKTYLRAFDGASRLVDTVIHTHTYDQALAVLDNASSCLRVAPASLPA
jgi:tRNA-dihydrouridine synthase